MCDLSEDSFASTSTPEPMAVVSLTYESPPGSMKNHNNNRKRTASGRRSKWWAHFEEEADAQNQKFACCKYCNAKYKKDGTGNMGTTIPNYSFIFFKY